MATDVRGEVRVRPCFFFDGEVRPSVSVFFFLKVKSVCPSYGPTEFRGSGNFWAEIRASEKRKPRSPWFLKDYWKVVEMNAMLCASCAKL